MEILTNKIHLFHFDLTFGFSIWMWQMSKVYVNEEAWPKGWWEGLKRKGCRDPRRDWEFAVVAAANNWKLFTIFVCYFTTKFTSETFLCEKSTVQSLNMGRITKIDGQLHICSDVVGLEKLQSDV